jgi:hypothetical protein
MVKVHLPILRLIYAGQIAHLSQLRWHVDPVGRVRKIHISQPLDGIIEATVTVRYGERLRVVAIRFEGLDHRWLCTALEII